MVGFLIVGRCNDDMLQEIYEYVKKIMHDEYAEISTSGEHKVKVKIINR